MRNRIVDIRSSILLAAALLLSFVTACQQAHLAEYRAYANDADVPRISVEEAKKDYDAGIAVIVDSRADSAYAQEHIVGSINIPAGSPESEFSKIPQGKKIIVYCSWPSEHTSASLAFQMNQKNIANTYALQGGTQAWKSAGYPMEGNNTPISSDKTAVPNPPALTSQNTAPQSY